MTKKIENKWLATGIEGIRVGLKAFVATYLISFIIALVVNLSVIEKLQDYLQGTLATGVGFNVNLITKTAAIIMNVAMFNSSGNIQLGILIFAVLPLIGFFIADRQGNEKEGMDFYGFLVYFVASLIFTLILGALSFLTKGDYLGMTIDFFSLKNLVMTFVISFLMQMAIGLNYNGHILPGIIATRWMLRLTILFNGGLAIFGIIYGLTKVTSNVSVIILATLVLAPNIAVYIFFTMMGISISFNEPLMKLMDYANIQVSYDTIPLSFRIVLLVIFAMFIAFSMARIEKGAFWQGVIGFAMSYPLISILVAYATRINLGVVRGMMDVQFGIDLLASYLYPLIAIVLVSILTVVIKQLINVIKEG